MLGSNSPHMLPEDATYAALPEDPEPGDEYVLQDGQVGGTVNTIQILQGPNVIGVAQSVAPIPNVGGKYHIDHLTCKKELKRRDVIRVKSTQRYFNKLTFIEFLGWCGTGTREEEYVAFEKFLKVRDTIPTVVADGIYMYERVCLEIIKGVQK